MKKLSPLSFSDKTGPVPRIMLAGGLLILCGFLLYFTIVGIKEGQIYFGSKFGGHIVHRDRSPNRFWIAVVVTLGLSLSFILKSVRELIFTARRVRRQKENA